MRSYEEISNRIMQRGDEIIESRKLRAAKIKHTSYAVSGLCAAVITGIGVWHMASSAPKRNNKPSETETIISTETTSEKTASSSFIQTTATETSSVYKTTASASSLKTTSLHKTTTSTETSAVSAAATTKPVSSAVSSENTTNSTTAANTATATVSSAENTSTQSSASTTSENIITSKHDTQTTTTTYRPPATTTTTIYRPPNTTTTTTATHAPFTTTATTAKPDPVDENVIEKTVSIKTAIKDIDTGEYLSGTLTLYRSYSAGHRAVLQTFTLDSGTYETAPEIIAFYKDSTAKLGVCIGNLPAGYELVQEDPDNYDYYNKYIEISENDPEVSEITFYVRKTTADQ